MHLILWSREERMDIGFSYKSKEKIFVEKEVGGVPYLAYPLLEKTELVRHGFSTRLGGVSKGVCSTMNLSFARGDDEEAVRENYRRMAAALHVEEDSFVLSAQTHTTNIRVVTEKDRGKGLIEPLDYSNVDGLVTDEPGLCLTTFYADCVPLFFLDPVKKVIGLSHSGWRGTVGRIGERTLAVMKDTYGSNPENVLAAIGPSICQSCYEVSEDVINAFRQHFSEKDWKVLFYRKENGKYQLNLWKANEIVLKEAGIREENLAVTNLCTCCNSELLFSHRASEGKRGNLAAFLALK